MRAEKLNFYLELTDGGSYLNIVFVADVRHIFTIMQCATGIKRQKSASPHEESSKDRKRVCFTSIYKFVKLNEPRV